MDLEVMKEALRPFYLEAKKTVKDGYVVLGIMLAVAFIGLLSGIKSGSNVAIFGVGIIVLLAIIIFTFIVSKATREYQRRIKEEGFPIIFQQIFSDVEYRPNEGVSKELMRDIALIDLGQDYETEDYLSGIYKNVRFRRADVETSTTTVSSDGKTTTTQTTVYFKGQVYAFKFNKSINNYIRIRERSGFFSKFSKGVNVKQSRKVTFEDVSFNDNFHVVTNDEHMAFYVVTPQFMNRLKTLINRVHGAMSFVIENDTLYVAVYNDTNSFEMKGVQEFDEIFVEKILNQVEVIQEVIDTLNLDSDLFKEMN